MRSASCTRKNRGGRPRKHKRHVLYARFSPRPTGRGENGKSSDGDRTESIEWQMEEMERYCKERGYRIHSRHEDRMASGADEDRPGLWDAIDSLGRGDVLVLYSIDRLARDMRLFAVIENALDSHGATLECVTGGIVYNGTAEEQLHYSIMKAFTQYWRQVIAARTKAAAIRHMRNGRIIGWAPYGMRPDPSRPTHMIPDPTEQAVIAWVREAWRNGETCVAIANKLNVSGVCRRNGRPTWRQQCVQELIRRLRASDSSLTRLPVEQRGEISTTLREIASAHASAWAAGRTDARKPGRRASPTTVETSESCDTEVKRVYEPMS